MYVNFQQGIITYPVTGSLQAFLAKTGNYVSIQTVNGQVDVTFAHGESNYLLTEASDVNNAWGPITNGVDTWLYWDIDAQTAVRTFGITTLQPQYGTTFPVSPAATQHFFDTSEKQMYVYQSGVWTPVIRAFAAKVNTSTFTPLGSGFPSRPYSGTQVGLSGTPINAGRIIVDNTATPIRKVNGEFFTTEDDFFVNGSPVNTIRLEANVLTGTAIENMGAFQVVQVTDFGKIGVATYNDLQTTLIAMLMEDLVFGQAGTIITQGTVTNPAWNFTTAGAELWVDGSGVFTEADPHVGDPITYPVKKPPIGRVITPTTIFFDQGLGGIGPAGSAGGGSTVDLATNTDFGIVKLSLAALDSLNPIVAGDNDPRLSDARAPLAHTQSADTVTFVSYGSITGPQVQSAIEQLEDQKLNVTGGTLSGTLTLNGNPINPLDAATKQYVDSLQLDNLTDVTTIVPSAGDVLVYTGTVWTNQPPAFIPKDFIQLEDTPSDYIGYGECLVRVNATEDGLEFDCTPYASTFLELTDSPSDYTGFSECLVRVNNAETGLEFFCGTLPSTFTDLTDTPGSYTTAGELVVINAGNNGLTFITCGTAGQVLTSNGCGSLPTWEDPTGGGTTIYDIGGTVAAVPNPNDIVMNYVSTRTITMPGDFAGSFAKAQDAATGATSFDVQKNGGSIGTIAFAPSATSGTFTSSGGLPQTLFPGDVLTVVAPGSPDATLARVAITFLGDLASGTTFYDVGGASFGAPLANELVINHVFVRVATMADDFVGSYAEAQTAATALTVFDVQRNGVSIGTVTFAAAGTSGTFVTTGGTPEGFVPGDVLTVVAPGTPDVTLADVAITFLATV